MGHGWSSPRPEAEVATGKLRGKTEVSRAGSRYHAFLGIPYAKPPVGELRFKDPEPAEPWAGVRDASVEGNPSLQAAMPIPSLGSVSLKQVWGVLKNLPNIVHRISVSKKQSEDCLFLNVFVRESTFTGTKQANEPQPLRPVLFWIHGGAFKLGDGNPDVMNPEVFLDKDIVVVTINYRLGPLGFLALGTTDVPGNAGLKDQSLALRWTRDNIKAFGGDPDAITVYGESAGGASAHYHTLSPLSRGLFRSVIASSGSAVKFWATTKNGLECARGLAKELGLEANSPEELAKGLRSVSAPRIIQAATKMPAVFDGMTDELMFLPVVEPAYPGAFIAEDPVAMVRDGKSAPVPVLTGCNTAEGLVWAMFADPQDEKVYKHVNEWPDYFLPPDLREGLSKEQRDRCKQDILDEFTGGKPFSKDNIAAFIEMYGDIIFLNRQVLLVHLLTAAGKSPVYNYRFDFVGKFNALKGVVKAKLGKGVKIEGAAHGDDLWYLSDIRLFALPTVDSDSREMVCRKRMVQLWTNFIETGNPTPPGTLNETIPLEWKPCSIDSQHFLDISDKLEIRSDNFFPRQAFWEGLYQKYLGRSLKEYPA